VTSRQYHDPSTFISRELSWLAFNERVFGEAEDPTTPLLERLKFAAIVASNLDEFFMVRVAGLIRAVDAGDTTPDLAGLTPSQQLEAVRERTQALAERLSRVVMSELLPRLVPEGVRLFRWTELDESQQAALRMFFANAVLPVLTPLAIDVSRPFPLLSSLSLNLALRLDAAPGQTDERLAIVQLPARLSRLVAISVPQTHAFVLLEDVIRAQLERLFPGQTILESAVIRLSRDSELELDDEGGRTHLEMVEKEVRRRRRSDVVRLEIEASASDALVSVLTDQLDIAPADVYRVTGPVDLRVLMGLVELPGFEPLRDPPAQPVNVLAADDTDLFSVLDERDVLLHHPYHSFEPVLAFLAQAAEDSEVLAIKQTLYRTSAGSPLIASLRRAAECNKQVTVLVEVTARFDEERNIQGVRELEAAGAHVIYGIRGYKTHAKICLVVRRSPTGLRRYVHLGTGNYNERTARLYTDFGLLTSSDAIAEDASAVFNALTGYSDPPALRSLVMAPTGLRRRFLKLISRERRRAEGGLPAEIMAKMNSLIDDEIIEALYAASRAGVRIALNVRGICALRPGLPGVSSNIEVISVVDRFLEHSRIYYFLNGGESEVYLASADWMTRNLNRRIELMFRIEHPGHHEQVVNALRAMFQDNTKAHELGADGVYRRKVPAPGEPRIRVQQILQDHARRDAALTRDRAGVRFRPVTKE
jgi:polyphosphate kinase